MIHVLILPLYARASFSMYWPKVLRGSSTG